MANRTQETVEENTGTVTQEPDTNAEAQAILAAAQAEADRIKAEADKIKAEAEAAAAAANKLKEEAAADAKKEKAELKEKAAALEAKLAELEAAAAAEASDPHTQEQEEMVSIKLFKDGDKYKDDVFVAVNGRQYLIKRGETVQVPRSIAEVLEQSMEQDTATANLITRESGEYANEAARRGL